MSVYPVWSFLLVTLLLSIVSFSLMFWIPNGKSPESTGGLFIWLVAIWSPSIAAMVVFRIKGSPSINVKTAFAWPHFSFWYLIILIPLAVGAILLLNETLNGHKIEWSKFELRFVIPLLLLNLIMGPLGEELGWRGFLYPIFKDKYGWMAGALMVGFIWAFWHFPLWFLDSPQSKISFWAFVIIVVLLSILMSIMYNQSKGSIIPAILLHLTFNVSLGMIDILESHDPSEFIIQSLYIYVPLVLILVGIYELTADKSCVIN